MTNSGEAMRGAVVDLGLLSVATFTDEELGASFDSKKASTEVEKTICADAELSKLDDDLARAYADALKPAREADRQQLWHEQRTWLNQRDACGEARWCVFRNCRRQIAALTEPGMSPSQRSWGSAWPRIEPESEKLTIIRNVVRGRMLAPAPLSVPSCIQALRDLVSGKNYAAIEPEVRAESEKNLRLDERRQCDKAEEQDVRDSGHPYLGLYRLSGPPYRYYRVEVGGKRDNGSEDVLHHEGGFGAGRGPRETRGNGYTWADIERCSTKRQVQLLNVLYKEPPPMGPYKLSLLAKYRSELVAIELGTLHSKEDDPKNMDYRLEIHWLHGERPAKCAWR